MDELDLQAKQFRVNAESLEGLCEKLTHLSQDKRKARKSYHEEHTKIALRLTQVSFSISGDELLPSKIIDLRRKTIYVIILSDEFAMLRHAPLVQTCKSIYT